METESEKEIFKSILSYAESALKTVILINGGACLALLAFLGNIIAKGINTKVVIEFSFPILLYVAGVLVGAIATGAAYLTQYSYIHFSRKTAVMWHFISAIFVIVAYVAFAAGSYMCYIAFTKIA
jgi:hypothetical protein